MPDHGATSSFPDWYIRFQQAALAALPRPPQLDQATALDWAENKSGAMKQGFQFLVSPEQGNSLVVPEFRVLWTIQRGKHTSYEVSREALQAAGCRISDWADDILKRVDFAIGPEELDLVAPSVAEFGFSSGATRKQIYDRAFELGLEKVPAWAGPVLREAYQDQPSGEWLPIGMEPIAVSGGYLCVFRVARYAGGRWLRSDGGHPDDFWLGSDRWVFVLRK